MKRIICIFGIIIMLCVSGCHAIQKEEEKSDINYTETKMELPQDISYIADAVADEEGNIKAIAIDGTNDQVYVWEYLVNESKWTSVYNLTELLGFGNAENLEMAAIETDGRIFCRVTNKDDIGEFIFVDTERKALSLGALSDALTEGNLIPNVYFNSEGVLTGFNLPSGVSIINEKSGEVEQNYLESGNAAILSADQYKDKLSIITNDDVRSFDINTQKEVETDNNIKNFLSDISDKKKSGKILNEYIYYKEINEKESLFGVSTDGVSLYQDGKKGKKLVQGSQTSFGDVNQFLAKMLIVNEDKFYTLMHGDQGSSFYKYEKNEHQQDTIYVFSIENNQSLQQAIIMFKQKNPDVNIELEIGLEGDESLSSSDIIRKLNTEILGGNGPDIVITDGMVLQNYLDGDSFMDLKDIIKKVDNEEGLLESIVNTFEYKNKICAIPTRFAFMAAAGSDNVAKNNADIESLISALENEKGDIDTLSAWGMGHMATILYRSDMCLKYNQNGKLTKDDINNFYEILARLYRLCDMENTHEGGKAIDKSFVDLDIVPISYSEVEDVLQKKQLATIDYINNLDDYNMFAQAEKQGIPFSLINHSKGDIFYPYSTMAINSNTKKPDVCKRFVEFLLSSDSQCSDRYTGIPVNVKAIEEMERQITAEAEEHENATLTDLEWDSCNQLLEELDTASECDIIVMDIVLSNAEAFLRNEKSMDEATDTVMKKIDIYQSE